MRIREHLAELTGAEQLQVAGHVLAQVIDIYVCRAEQLLDTWEEKYNSSPCEPILSADPVQVAAQHDVKPAHKEVD